MKKCILKDLLIETISNEMCEHKQEKRMNDVFVLKSILTQNTRTPHFGHITSIVFGFVRLPW